MSHQTCFRVLPLDRVSGPLAGHTTLSSVTSYELRKVLFSATIAIILGNIIHTCDITVFFFFFGELVCFLFVFCMVSF